MTAIGLGHPGSMRDEEGSESDRGKPSFRTSTPAPSRRWRECPFRGSRIGAPSAWQRLRPTDERVGYERGEAKRSCRSMCDLVCVFAIGLTISGDFRSRTAVQRHDRWTRSVFGGSRAGRIRKEACDPIWAIQKVCFYVRSSLLSTFGGMQHTLLSHLGCTHSPIHVGKSMLCGAELSVGVDGVFLASTVSPQRGWGGSL